VKNALGVFLKAKSFKMEALALAALMIIFQNLDQVKQSDEWQKEDGSKLSQMMAETMAFKNSRKRDKTTAAGHGGFNFFIQF
jgi:hypothetical protein